MWENNEFKAVFKEDAIHDFEQIMLTSGECTYLMPMVFVGENDGKTAYYNCSGFAPLSSFKIEKTEDAMYILEKVLLIMGRVVEYLITPAKVTLTMDTVFYNQDTGEIKIAYVPLTGSAVSLRRNLIEFIAEIKVDICDGYGEYLDKTAKLIHYRNYRINEVIGRVGMFKRELYRKTSASS